MIQAMAPESAQEKQADENVIASPPPIEVNSDTPGVAIEGIEAIKLCT
jgi:hypothetical protein